MHAAHGYAAQSSKIQLAPFEFARRDLRANDVHIDILYCGVCHSDIHTAHVEWDGTVYAGGTVYRCVPGHEIVGKVNAVDKDVKRFKAGDFVAAGTMVDGCKECVNCLGGIERHCL